MKTINTLGRSKITRDASTNHQSSRKDDNRDELGRALDKLDGQQLVDLAGKLVELGSEAFKTTRSFFELQQALDAGYTQRYESDNRLREKQLEAKTKEAEIEAVMKKNEEDYKQAMQDSHDLYNLKLKILEGYDLGKVESGDLAGVLEQLLHQPSR